MTNAEIILSASFDLLKKGLIKSTGRTLQIKDDDGNVQTCPEPEAIHTYAIWKALGYQVKRGETAVAAIRIWKITMKQVEVEGKDPKTGEPANFTTTAKNAFMKTAHFFTESQCEPIK